MAKVYRVFEQNVVKACSQAPYENAKHKGKLKSFYETSNKRSK